MCIYTILVLYMADNLNSNTVKCFTLVLQSKMMDNKINSFYVLSR